MQARVKNLKLDIERLNKPIQQESVDETIEGMYYTKAVTSGPPPPGTVGDRTASVALSFRRENEETNHDSAWLQIHEKAAVEEELDRLQCLLAKVDNAIASLEPMQREIITLFYINKKNWPQITIALHEKHKAYYSERHCRRVKAAGIKYMIKSMFGYSAKVTA
ncbi:hypothetical protein V6C27_02870 [Peptococcaceae bacterium 1198_IL3148]